MGVSTTQVRPCKAGASPATAACPCKGLEPGSACGQGCWWRVLGAVCRHGVCVDCSGRCSTAGQGTKSDLVLRSAVARRAVWRAWLLLLPDCALVAYPLLIGKELIARSLARVPTSRVRIACRCNASVLPFVWPKVCRTCRTHGDGAAAFRCFMQAAWQSQITCLIVRRRFLDFPSQDKRAHLQLTGGGCATDGGGPRML